MNERPGGCGAGEGSGRRARVRGPKDPRRPWKGEERRSTRNQISLTGFWPMMGSWGDGPLTENAGPTLSVRVTLGPFFLRNKHFAPALSIFS